MPDAFPSDCKREIGMEGKGNDMQRKELIDFVSNPRRPRVSYI
jgi:hypothetical protein